MKKRIEEVINEKISLAKTIKSSDYADIVSKTAAVMVEALKNGNKLLIAGNGGSAADAQHFAAELVGRFLMERPALPAISLCVDPSGITCIGNDYGFDDVFARQTEGLGNAGDILVLISTSGNSANCIKAIDVAKKKGLKTIGFLGRDGGKMKDLCDMSIVIPSNVTARIQEWHTTTIHLLCEEIEIQLFQ